MKEGCAPHPYCSVSGCVERSAFAGLCTRHMAMNPFEIGGMPNISGINDITKPNDIVSVNIGRRKTDDMSMAEKYPRYYKRVPAGTVAIDIYAVCQMFGVDDASGALQHALKKIMLPGVRTGGKSRYDDIKEARDTLNRWLELHAGDAPKLKSKE